MTNTVSNATAIKTKVATIERGDKRPMPQIPCPLVQPLPKLEPKPTNNPATAITNQLASIELGNEKPKIEVIIGPTIIPTRNSKRQLSAKPFLVKQLLKIPEIPAILPLNRSRITADRPIIAPPTAAVKGVNSVIVNL